jgi:Uncharacterized proteins of the AP superfamily
MLPAGFTSAVSLADVLTSSLSGILGEPNRLGLRDIDRAVAVLADGLGAQSLHEHSGHARYLAPRLTRATTIDSGFPTTTAAALATLCTGTTPGTHGMVGYRSLDPERDRVFDHLSGWDGVPDPSRWQRSETVFEHARAQGVNAYVIGPERYRASPLTRAILRGADYVAAKTMTTRVEAAEQLLRNGGRSLIYLYVPELDLAAHASGVHSDAWVSRLEELDAAVCDLGRALRGREGAFLTADHGMIDVPATGHVMFDGTPELVDGVRHVSGDPRCIQLHVDAETEVAALAEAWRAAEGHRAWIATRDEAISAGWFGPTVEDAVRLRIGDVLVAARARIAYYDSSPAGVAARSMVGQHGSFSPEEVKVPLIGLGEFG